MKRTILLAVLFTSVIFMSGCKEECEKSGMASITISNTSNNPYDFYINNSFIERINGNSISKDIAISEGNNQQLYAVQVSGYIFFPTEVFDNLNVIACSEYSWQIP